MHPAGSPRLLTAVLRMSLLAAIPAPSPAAPPRAPASVPACDDARAVEAVKAEAARQGIDVSTLQLAVEGPYGRGKFVRTHPTFRTSPALDRKLAKRTFYFVWFHPPFRAAGTRGTDVWGLVDTRRCELLHLVRER